MCTAQPGILPGSLIRMRKMRCQSYLGLIIDELLPSGLFVVLSICVRGRVHATDVQPAVYLSFLVGVHALARTYLFCIKFTRQLQTN